MTPPDAIDRNVLNTELERPRDAKTWFARAWPILSTFLTGGLLVIAYEFGLRPRAGLLPFRLQELLFLRGPIQDLTMIAACFVLGDLLVKMVRAVRVERRARKLFSLDQPTPLSSETLLDLCRQATRLCGKTKSFARSIWGRRVLLALSSALRNPARLSVRQDLASIATSDEESAASSYQVSKVLLWAIPLLGFIGTVSGIAAGISDFGRDLSERTQRETQILTSSASSYVGQQSEMKELQASLGKVTNGLGIAFDTTYLALVVTVGLMIALTLVEKADFDRLAQYSRMLEAYFVEQLPDADKVDYKALSENATQVDNAARTMSASSAVVEQFAKQLNAGLSVRIHLPGSQSQPPL